MNINDINLEKYGNLPLECDGFTRVFEYLLTQNNIDHQGYTGTIHVGEKSMTPHYWIVCGESIIDFAIRIWFGNDLPNGIIKINEISLGQDNTIIKTDGIKYVGRPYTLDTNRSIFQILTREL